MYRSGNFSNYIATSTAIEAASTARETKTDEEFMKHDMERLLLISQAMWEFMKKEHGYTDDDLSDMVGRIEAKRGETNAVPGKDAPIACPACGRMNTASRQFCIYCGKQMLKNPFAR